MGEASGRQEIERRLIERSLRDDDFRQRLLADPRTTTERELGVRLPEEVRVEPDTAPSAGEDPRWSFRERPNGPEDDAGTLDL